MNLDLSLRLPPTVTAPRLLVMGILLALNGLLLYARFDSVVAGMVQGEYSAFDIAVLLFVGATTLWVGLQAEQRFKYRATTPSA